MTLKATWLWTGSAGGGRQVYGFSESWYTDLSPAQLTPSMQAIAAVRAQMLAEGCELFGFRIADTTPGSRAYTSYPTQPVLAPAGNGTPNVPQDAALCQVLGSVAGTVKRFWLHNLPDAYVVDANFAAPATIRAQSAAFNNALQADGYKFRYTVPSSPTAPIQSINNLGVVNLQQPLVGAALFSIVQLFHVRGVDGRGKRGKYQIIAFTDTQNFTLGHWPGDIVAASGKLRLTQYGYTTIVPVPGGRNPGNILVRPGTRKCGRPFGQLRGRAVARR
jgi:hypothetical protein